MKNIKKYNKIIINIVMALFSYLAFLIYFRVIFSKNSYNFMYTLLFFIIFYLYSKDNLKYYKNDIRTKLIIGIFSFVLSFILIVGSIVYSYVGDKTAIIFNIRNIIYSIVGVIGFYFFFRLLVNKIFDKIKKIEISGQRKMKAKIFMEIMILMILCWSPYFLRYFPGVMSPDSYYSLHYITNGILSDYHTFFHTWFVGFFILIGQFLFDKLNYAVAFYIIIQMIINAFVFTLIIKFLYEKNVNKIIVFLVGLWFCLSPLYAIYSITLWRDILFGLAFVTLFISLYNYVDSGYKLSINNVIMYLLSVFVILFFRNNGIYVFLLFVPIFIIFYKYNRKIIAISNIIIIIVYFLIKGPIFDYFNVQKTTSSEAYSVPLQQISRVIASGEKIDSKDYKYLSSIIDLDKVSEDYKPTISDPVKRLVNNDNLSDNKLNFLGYGLNYFLNILELMLKLIFVKL